MSNEICFLTEEAVVAYLIAQAPINDIPAGNIWTGLSRGVVGDDLAALEESAPMPNVIVICQRAAPIDREGNWEAFVTLRTQSHHRKTTAPVFRARAKAVHGQFMTGTETLADAISAAKVGYHAQFTTVGEQRWRINGGKWIDEFEVKIACSGSDLV
jgi:hypothetical protein